MTMNKTIKAFSITGKLIYENVAFVGIVLINFFFAVQAVAQTGVATGQPTIITFEVPGAGTGEFQGTVSLGINTGGAITGIYTDANNLNHGFIRNANGSFITFDVPEAGTGAGQGTWPQSINADDAVAGLYFDSNNLTHGFVRDASGNFATFPCLLATNAPAGGGAAMSINSAGAVTGYCADSANNF